MGGFGNAGHGGGSLLHGGNHYNAGWGGSSNVWSNVDTTNNYYVDTTNNYYVDDNSNNDYVDIFGSCTCEGVVYPFCSESPCASYGWRRKLHQGKR